MVQKAASPQKTEEKPARRRGRPRQYDSDQALARAAEVFWKNGYAGTSLDDLVVATGMNRPSLYAAFGDKRDLYLKTLEQYQQRARAIGAQIIADDPPLRVFLRRFYDAALDIYLADGAEARGCYSISTAPAQATTDVVVRKFLAASFGATDAYLASQIAKARDRGELLSQAEPMALAQLATATLHTIAVRARVGTPRKQLVALTAGAIDVICRQQKS
jgi:TetR/AcrR family transcriptional regulator, copper-responsive repressor